jgi:hypothetical protein
MLKMSITQPVAQVTRVLYEVRETHRQNGSRKEKMRRKNPNARTVSHWHLGKDLGIQLALAEKARQ